MVLTSPQYTMRTWFTQGHAAVKALAANMLYDSDNDGTADATPTFSAVYEMPQTQLTNFFTTKNYDGLFVIGNPRTKVITPGPVAYEYTITIQPVVVEKGGNRDAAADLLWKMHNEIRRVIRENAVGSLKLLEGESPKIERMGGSTLLYVDAVEVLVSSAVSSYSTATDLVTTRRFYMRVKEWRVGFHTDATDYKYVGPESGLWPVEFDPYPPVIIYIPIPGATPVRQILGPAQPKGRLRVRDLDAITQLLRTIDVVSGGATEVAVPSTITRYTIGYFCIVVDEIKVTNATDARSAVTSSFVFSNTMIDGIHLAFDEQFGGFDVDFTFDSVTQTDT